MPLIVGLCLVPFVVWIVVKANSIRTTKKAKFWLNFSLIAIFIVYFIFTAAVNMEPFNIDITYSVEYSILAGDYAILLAVVLVFTPFSWVIIFHFMRLIVRKCKISKKAIIKRKEDLQYYRDDLDKVSPSIIMFTSSMELDDKKSIAATILKLKLTGHIKEENGELYCMMNGLDTLSKSERMVHRLVYDSSFNINEYRKAVVDEAIKNKYIKKNIGGAFVRILKMILAVVATFDMLVLSFVIESSVYENYTLYPGKDGKAYYIIEDDEEKEELFEEVTDKNDYYHTDYGNGNVSYYYSAIGVTCLEYKVVRKVFFLNVLGLICLSATFIMSFATLGYILLNIKNITKNYRRTAKGRELVTKAYALKNYLEDFSIIKERTEAELVLWEYYLIYAVALGVNKDIDDEVMKKYVRYINVERYEPYFLAK